ncbi:2,3-dihydro-2,3-dihydroxybenzoate dehydrogenase [Kitasatospora sp. LaBMicrA B282]|uniref:2,3-dihydro-2,3-dihydroxybenzoate dehydrogenase n=1 Tax=Kitasatospora sp. LaBMicrA B282 TaxID=3420949 RepID=UPI003D0FAEDE
MRGKIAVVTGAAGGIGAAVARALAADGAVVAAVDRDAAGARTTADKLVADGLAAHAFVADVSREAEAEAVVAAVEEQLGPVHYLVNAAGVLRLGEAGDFSEQDWLETFAVNSTGVFLMSRAVVRRMVPRGAGALVTVASNAAGTARTQMSAYAASKAAALMFTKCLGLEVARHGIRCNVVAPGSTDTPMLHSMWSDETGPARTIEGSPEAYKAGIPLRKLASPTDIADAVHFLLSDRAGHITLQHLTVDGGATLGV